jgi:hydrogenase nickel incorporation protein HypA/HybF
MHEMALAESIVEIAEAAAREHGAARVTEVRVEIGALSHVERDALSFCFDAVTRGGIAQGARLAFVATPGAAWCMPCGETVTIERRGDACPRCGSHQLEVTGGDRMRVKDIAVA